MQGEKASTLQAEENPRVQMALITLVAKTSLPAPPLGKLSLLLLTTFELSSNLKFYSLVTQINNRFKSSLLKHTHKQDQGNLSPTEGPFGETQERVRVPWSHKQAEPGDGLEVQGRGTEETSPRPFFPRLDIAPGGY